MGVAPHPITAKTTRRPNPLLKLRFGTGWLYLGDLDVKEQAWATVLKHEVEKSVVPRPGDVLEITREHPVVIMDFRLTAEEGRLLSPANDPDRRHLTGLNLPAGTKVKVEEVSRNHPVGPGPIQSVWVRVVAAE